MNILDMIGHEDLTQHLLLHCIIWKKTSKICIKINKQNSTNRKVVISKYFPNYLFIITYFDNYFYSKFTKFLNLLFFYNFY